MLKPAIIKTTFAPCVAAYGIQTGAKNKAAQKGARKSKDKAVQGGRVAKVASAESFGHLLSACKAEPAPQCVLRLQAQQLDPALICHSAAQTWRMANVAAQQSAAARMRTGARLTAFLCFTGGKLQVRKQRYGSCGHAACAWANRQRQHALRRASLFLRGAE